jgi:hypothetical protein
MNLVRHQGLELPVYPTDEALCLTAEYVDAAARGLSSFIRLVRTVGPDQPLKDRLRYADDEFNTIADLCDVKIVPHTWGLCEYSSEKALFSYEPSTIVPKGYLLVAKVDCIEQSGPVPDSSFASYMAGESQYLQLDRSGSSVYRADIQESQIIYGSRVAHTEEPSSWFVDIEPILLK